MKLERGLLGGVESIVCVYAYMYVLRLTLSTRSATHQITSTVCPGSQQCYV